MFSDPALAGWPEGVLLKTLCAHQTWRCSTVSCEDTYTLKCTLQNQQWSLRWELLTMFGSEWTLIWNQTITKYWKETFQSNRTWHAWFKFDMFFGVFNMTKYLRKIMLFLEMMCILVNIAFIIIKDVYRHFRSALIRINTSKNYKTELIHKKHNCVLTCCDEIKIAFR